MQFVPVRSNYSTQMKAVIEKRQGLAFGPFVCFIVTYKEFDFLGQEPADRSLTPGGENLRFFEHSPAQTYGYILFPTVSRSCHKWPPFQFSRILRVARMIRIVKIPQIGILNESQ
jgi:hypothetical protein